MRQTRTVLEGSTLYQTHSPLQNCSKLILQYKRLVYIEDYKDISGLLRDSGIE
jgi:deoxycytidylate deaminase